MTKVCYWDAEAQSQKERDMTPEEEAQRLADIAAATPTLVSVKVALISDIDDTIATIYNRWLRFDAEYTAREAAARAYVAGNPASDPGIWITSFASNSGMSNAAAANLIIAQADALRGALTSLGALRMAKYGIQGAANEVAARSTHDTIISQAKSIAAALG